MNDCIKQALIACGCLGLVYCQFKLTSYGDALINKYWLNRKKRNIVGKILTCRNIEIFDSDAVISISELDRLLRNYGIHCSGTEIRYEKRDYYLVILEKGVIVDLI